MKKVKISHKSLLSLVLSILVFSGCQEKTTDISNEELSLKEQFSILRPVTFEINNLKDTTIFGKRGTTISIPKEIFMLSNNKLIDSQIKIELTECYTRREIIESGIETKYNDSLLISFGFINIQASSINGDLLTLRDGAYLTIQLDSNYIDKSLNPDVYYGEFSASKNSVKWNKDTAFHVTELTRVELIDTVWLNLKNTIVNVYLTGYAINAPKLGWINLDVVDTVSTKPLVVTIKDFDLNGDQIMMVFKDQRSFALETVNGDIVNIKNLPNDAEVILMKYGVKNSKPYFGSTEVKVGTVDSVELPIKYCSIDEINQQLEKLEF